MKINLKDAMTGLQAQMDAKLTLSRKTITHPTSVGDVSELEWIRLLGAYLPNRYSVDKGFIVDHTGSVSQQIDILIYDKQYTPFIFHLNGIKYIPAEAVYAAIECKQDVSKRNLEYTAGKARSVRKLKRTSLAITHAGGEYPPKKPHQILFGLVCVGGNLSNVSANYLEKLDSNGCVNFVCSLSGVYARVDNFDLWKKNSPPHKLSTSKTNLSLVSCVVHLIADLQSVGTVPAIDVLQYLPK